MVEERVALQGRQHSNRVSLCVLPTLQVLDNSHQSGPPKLIDRFQKLPHDYQTELAPVLNKKGRSAAADIS